MDGDIQTPKKWTDPTRLIPLRFRAVSSTPVSSLDLRCGPSFGGS